MADEKRSIARLEKDTLPRKLGVTDLFAVGYGDLGSSIFYALGITTFFALGAAPISLVLAGIVFVCTSLTYAEMTAAIPASGGSASFARIAFNDFVSFIAGWGLLLDFIVTIAISIFVILPYLSFFYGGPIHVSVHLAISVGIIGILYIVNYFGVQHSTRISIFLTGIALFTQVLILILALFGGVDLVKVFEQMKIGVQANWSPTWDNFLKGTAMAMVAYTGIESIAALGSETKRPIKTLPRAVMIVMSVLVTMYLAISVIGLSVMSPQELGTKYVDNPILGIVNNLPFGSAALVPWVGFLAAGILFVAGNAGLMGASRLSFNMGEHYQLPQFFYRTHKKYRTPVVSLGIFAILAALVIIWSRGKLHFLADLYNFGAMLAFFSAHLSLIVLRIKQPEMHRPFRAPLNIRISKDVSIPLTAVVGALSTLAVWILVIVTKPEGRYLGFTWMGLGIIMYLLYRRKKKMPPMGQVKIEKVKISDFKPLEIKNILVPTKGGAETETVQMACEIAKVHGAKITAIHLVQVPYSLPLESPMPYRLLIGESILQRAEAIAREFGVEIETEILRARQIDDTILQYLEEKQFDLLVLGAVKSQDDPHAGLGIITERILRAAPCRVFV
ncbi:MAG: putative amino acid permease YhdG, partial [Chlamydiae bacterium]|nr:putative amino acid permease YhdG [Chlamydiota bacterium]